MQKDVSKEKLLQENNELRVRLEEAQEVLRAIQQGEVDALVVSTPKGEQVFTISGAEKPYRILIEQMKGGAVMISEDNLIVYCNSGFAKMMKYPLDKLIGSTIKNLIPRAQMADFEELVAQGRTGEGSMTKELSLKAADATFVPTHVSANTLRIENQKTTFLVITDLTEHMEAEVKRYTAELEQAQTRLYESEQRWATTLASVGDAVMATNLSGKITFMNKVAETLTGWKQQEASGKPIKQVFDIINAKTRQPVENPVAKVLEKGCIVGLANNTILCRKDGTEVWVDDSGAPIRSKEGKIQGVVLIFRDITVRKQMQAKLEDYAKNLEAIIDERTQSLQAAERLAAIGATAGMVGHDIRNPLQAIIGDLYLAKEELKGIADNQIKNSLQESIDAIEENVFYINKIVSDLQDFTKPLKPTFETINFKNLLTNVLLAAKVPDKIKIQVNAQENLPLQADPAYLRRALTNLVVNAVQAMPNGGTLTIQARQKQNNVIICIKDTGVGIPQEIKPNLFTPLFTTKAKGQGLGLAVVKRLIGAMNGTITFESKVGDGTKFIVNIPLNPQKK